MNAKLQRMKILASPIADDAEFLRRVYLDITGSTPTADEVRAFLADTTETQAKRTALVDRLLDNPLYVEHWTLKWSDLLLSRRKSITEKGVWSFRNWIRNAIASNKPYNEFAVELITANGSTFENPAANYYRIAREPKLVMENMTQVFLGTRFNCNQCHDHPFERWTQRQYYDLAAYFADVGRKPIADGDEIIFTLASPESVVNPDNTCRPNRSSPSSTTGLSSIRFTSCTVVSMADFFSESLLRSKCSQSLLELLLWARNHRPGDDIRPAISLQSEAAGCSDQRFC